jgi:peptidoglycan hydrolase-like protein with peptidoglycan-binding domain
VLVSFATRAFGALSVPVLGVPLVAGAAQATTVPKPPTKSLPSTLDIAPPYNGQKVCDPHAKPGVVAFAELMVSHYKVGSAQPWYMERSCNNGVTEHSDGRAWDWMLSVDNKDQKAIADSVVAWLSAPDAQGRPGAMARRFGIMYIIWNKKMWRAYDPGRGWAAYTGSAPHTDHIHFSFTWDGAYKRTSWWTGRAVTTVDPGPTPSPTTPPAAPSSIYTVLVQGSTGPEVALAQKVVGVPADGIFGPMTLAALKRWQAANRVPVTGKLDAATWARMVALGKVPARGGSSKPVTSTPPPATPATTTTSPLAKYVGTTLKRGATGAAVVALQKALAVPADGQFGPQTEGAVRAYQSRKKLPVTGVVATLTWKALMGQATPAQPTSSRGTSRTPVTTAPPAAARPTVTTAYTSVSKVVLKQGSTGTAVRVLQRALGGLAVDGAYGPRTAAAVSSFQKAHRLKATGVTDVAVWRALEARDYPLLRYRTTVLKKGSTGTAVVALQKALRIGADGQFGPQTESAVKALQGRAKIARTGVVASLTWQALEAELRRR